MNIVLIGYRGAGKSVVGRRLAELTGREFIDTDDRVEERAGAPIRAIVEDKGWAYFRRLEKKAVEEASRGDNRIIAPGGGAVLDAVNLMNLKRNGLVVWLQADLPTLRARMEKDPRTGDRRPSLTGKNAEQEMIQVIASRDPIYEQAADRKIYTSHLTAEEVAAEVLYLLRIPSSAVRGLQGAK